MPNILKKLKGPLSTAGKKNRNGRIYSKQLWENVLNSEYWKDMMSNHSLCGEVVHPGDRTESDSFEIDARNISHRISEAHFEGDKLMGTVEILDTEQGRNLLSLVNSGCIVGISARGMGDLDGDEVDPDTYNFKTFDITMRPSDPNARLVPLEESEKVRLVFTESEQSDRLIESPSTSKNSDNDLQRLDVLKTLMSYMNKNTSIPSLNFYNGGGHIKVSFKDEKIGDVLVSRIPTEDGDKFRIYSSTLPSINTQITYGTNTDELADSILNKFEALTKKGKTDLKEFDPFTASPEEIDDYYSNEEYNKATNAKDPQEVFEHCCLSNSNGS